MEHGYWDAVDSRAKKAKQDHARKVAELIRAARCTLESFQHHLQDDAHAVGLKSTDFLCPCQADVNALRSALTALDGGE